MHFHIFLFNFCIKSSIFSHLVDFDHDCYITHSKFAYFYSLILYKFHFDVYFGFILVFALSYVHGFIFHFTYVLFIYTYMYIYTYIFIWFDNFSEFFCKEYSIAASIVTRNVYPYKILTKCKRILCPLYRCHACRPLWIAFLLF